MTRRYSIADARNGFTQVIRDAEAQYIVEITRHGKPVAVLISVDAYERLQENRLDFWEAYQAFREEYDLAALDLRPEEVFADVRDPDPGREIDF